MLIFEDCANSALPARFFPLPRRFFLRRNGAGCFRRHVSYAPKGRCDMRRRLRRSAGHIFSAPEWRVVPPAAHSFLSCQKRMGRKEAPGTRNRADAPEKAFCFCVPFTDRAFRKERPSGGPQNFCHLKILLRQIFLPVKSKSICSESMRGFQVLPVSAPQFLLVAEEKRAKSKV